MKCQVVKIRNVTYFYHLARQILKNEAALGKNWGPASSKWHPLQYILYIHQLKKPDWLSARYLVKQHQHYNFAYRHRLHISNTTTIKLGEVFELLHTIFCDQNMPLSSNWPTSKQKIFTCLFLFFLIERVQWYLNIFDFPFFWSR